MKALLRVKQLVILGILGIVTMGLISCNKVKEEIDREVTSSLPVSPNEERVVKMVNSFDFVFKEYVASSEKLKESELNALYIKQLKKEGIFLSVEQKVTFSEKYLEYATQMASAPSFDSKESYVSFLNGLMSAINTDNSLSLEEKQTLVDNAYFMISFVSLLESYKDIYFPSTTNGKEKGWWEEWGKCAAGTVGEGILGGLGGFGVGGVVGAVIGVIGGALHGASSSC